MNGESAVLHSLFSDWVGLAQEYAQGAPDVRGFYIYASAERGARFANVYVDQGGTVRHPGDVEGIDSGASRVRQVQNLLVDDLLDAERRLAALGIPAPTEYRVFFAPRTRTLDVQLSREEQYGADSDRSPIHGIEYWLGERAPRLF